MAPSGPFRPKIINRILRVRKQQLSLGEAGRQMWLLWAYCWISIPDTLYVHCRHHGGSSLCAVEPRKLLVAEKLPPLHVSRH